MLPPAPVLTGPKGGRYVETASGRHYVDESYGQGPAPGLRVPEEHARARAAVERIFSAQPPAAVTALVKERRSGGATIFGVDRVEDTTHGPHSVTTVETTIYDGAHPKFDHFKAGELIHTAAEFDKLARQPTNTPVETQIYERKRDDHLALAERVYTHYLKYREEYNKKNGLKPGDPAYEPEKPNPSVALRLSQHMSDIGLGDIHDRQSRGWVSSSSSDDSLRLHGVLQAMGVPGSFLHKHPAIDLLLDQGKRDPEVQRYVREMYALSQAALARDGVKEVTLYRGVGFTSDPGIPRGESKITCRTRPASSWSDNFDTARQFAFQQSGIGVIMQATVPASQIYTYHRLFGNASGENEYVVLGMEGKEVEAMRPY